MERIKINLPVKWHFATTTNIRVTDLNYGGHVGNDTFLGLIHEARCQFLASLGTKELDLFGLALIMTDCGIEFKAELFQNDVLTMKVAMGEIDRMGFDLFYLLETERNGQTIVAGKAKTGMLCFNYNEKKKQALPATTITHIQSLLHFI
jgi:acyl-CoA thioester hydrolase